MHPVWYFLVFRNQILKCIRFGVFWFQSWSGDQFHTPSIYQTFVNGRTFSQFDLVSLIFMKCDLGAFLEFLANFQKVWKPVLGPKGDVGLAIQFSPSKFSSEVWWVFFFDFETPIVLTSTVITHKTRPDESCEWSFEILKRTSLVSGRVLWVKWIWVSGLQTNKKHDQNVEISRCGGQWTSLVCGRVLWVKSTSQKCLSGRVLWVDESCEWWL